MMKKIGTKLKKARIAKGLTLRQVAAKSKIVLSHVSMIENGKRKPSVDVLDNMCKALGLQLYEVVLHNVLKNFKGDKDKKNKIIKHMAAINSLLKK